MTNNHSNILSLTLSGHGFSGALCIDGMIIGATSLERITRKKNDILIPITRNDLKTFGWNGSPGEYESNLDLPFDLEMETDELDFANVHGFVELIDYLLEMGNLTLPEIDTVVYSYRYVEQAKSYFSRINPEVRFIEPEHHFSHACQAFLASPFKEAAILVLDGQGVPLDRTGGDQLSGCVGLGRENSIKILKEFPVRQSVGGFYANFTKAVGFETNQEGKTMGLAPYGSDVYYQDLVKRLKFNTWDFNLRSFRRLISRFFIPQKLIFKLPPDGSFLANFPRRKKYEPITDVERDLSYAVQKITEDVMIEAANWLYKETKLDNLCIAGGVGLNCVANYQVLIKSKFKNIFIHPNPGDNGLAVGQALYVYNILDGNERRYVAETDSLGRSYSDKEIDDSLEVLKLNSDVAITHYDNLDELYTKVALEISLGKIISWFQGRSEFGPRALGNRSILADPRRKEMKDILNSRVKFRESFRPFTPSVLANRSSEFFELDQESPFMLLAAYVKPGKAEMVPAITHVDNTARVQTVTREVNQRYFDLISKFDSLTGIPMILDTSFNVAGEPIVESPFDAVNCFLSTDIDLLCIGNYVILKKRK